MSHFEWCSFTIGSPEPAKWLWPTKGRVPQVACVLCRGVRPMRWHIVHTGSTQDLSIQVFTFHRSLVRQEGSKV